MCTVKLNSVKTRLLDSFPRLTEGRNHFRNITFVHFSRCDIGAGIWYR
jgi:hypothetical protein